MSKAMSDETMQTLGEALSKGRLDLLQKAFTQSTGLVNIDLQAGARIIYPVITPLRGMTPRVKANGGLGPNWRAIVGINIQNQYAGVSEGTRGGNIVTDLKSYFGNYKGLGLEDSVTFEADFAAAGFDDAKARAVEGLLRSLMIQEENVILGGNTSLALGKPDVVDITDNGSGGSIPSGTEVHVRVVALTHEGFQRATVDGGVKTLVTRTNAGVGGGTTTFGGGSSNISDDADLSTGSSSDSLGCTVPIVQGAVAYAWFWGATAAGATLGAITTINSVLIKTATGSGTQLASAITADNSKNELNYDGMLYLGWGAGQENPAATASGALLAFQDTGTPGVGTKLHSDGAAGIVEIEDDLQRFWDGSNSTGAKRLSPTHLFVNAQQYRDITALITAGGGAPLVRLVSEATSSSGVGAADLRGGLQVSTYVKKYGQGAGAAMKIVLHPDIAPGTMMYLHDVLPYPLSNVSNPFQLKLRRDYYQLEWPITSRKYEYGVYVDGLLQHYFPPSIGIRTNIAAGV